MDKIQILQNLPKYVQALYSDGTLYFSEDKDIATTERKNLVLNDIKLIEENINTLKQLIS